MAENGSISPQWHRTTCGQQGGRLKSNHRQTMAAKKKTTLSDQVNAAKMEQK